MKASVFIAVALAALLPAGGAGLADLASPDDVMLRRPAQKTATEAEAADDVERRFRELKAKAEAEQRAKAAAEKAAAEKAAAEKAAAERKAKEEAARRARAEAERKAQAEKAAAAKAQAEKAVAEKTEAERRAKAEAAAREAELKRLREQVATEKAAREQAEEKAARAEKRAAYLANPDPDERPAPKKRLEAATPAQDVTETPVVAVQKAGARKEKKALTGRAAVITADRTDYDRKEGVILFDRNVFVDDEQYQMHAERLFVFLDGTNDMKRLVALGNVAITNEDKSAWCTKAVYTKAASRIVMYGDAQHPAWLRDAGGKSGDASEVRGLRITYWIDSGLATVEKSVITLPGLKGTNSPKDLFNPGGAKNSKQDE